MLRVASAIIQMDPFSHFSRTLSRQTDGHSMYHTKLCALCVAGVACNVTADEGMLVPGSCCTPFGTPHTKNSAEICNVRWLQGLERESSDNTAPMDDVALVHCFLVFEFVLLCRKVVVYIVQICDHMATYTYFWLHGEQMMILYRFLCSIYCCGAATVSLLLLWICVTSLYRNVFFCYFTRYVTDTSFCCFGNFKAWL